MITFVPLTAALLGILCAASNTKRKRKELVQIMNRPTTLIDLELAPNVPAVRPRKHVRLVKYGIEGDHPDTIPTGNFTMRNTDLKKYTMTVASC